MGASTSPWEQIYLPEYTLSLLPYCITLKKSPLSHPKTPNLQDLVELSKRDFHLFFNSTWVHPVGLYHFEEGYWEPRAVFIEWFGQSYLHSNCFFNKVTTILSHHISDEHPDGYQFTSGRSEVLSQTVLIWVSSYFQLTKIPGSFAAHQIEGCKSWQCDFRFPWVLYCKNNQQEVSNRLTGNKLQLLQEFLS